jgi:eukaryotic-like serine/threonine-protein kinase
MYLAGRAMTELREQLEATVGTTYHIERELGGGGMGRVFLAEETALRRRVVIKVLPPGLAAGVNAERFRREIQLAASLQHPHIVQLLTAGGAGDLLYYVMPFIPGESLRAKLAREGELPVGEAVRILTDVVDALAAAHAQGVVHRDIKPDNVLLSGKHALVTDFGVAKAVSGASGSDSTLTSLGVALGTPAYMAPEQAAGDPHVDHRADLYAVGVLAYEMLAGRLPFSAASPQAMLAAHVTSAPAPLTESRRAVPPALAALVMRCLEKRPADRWQRAEDLLAELETLATPTGGMTPVGAPPHGADAVLAAIRRAHPVRVTLLFGAATLGVLGIVYVLMVRLGLPDWVLTAATALLAVGWPIMLATGRLERRRALARQSGGRGPADEGWLARRLTWRQALLGGAAAFGGLALVAAGYVTLRLFGIGPVGTLLAKGAIKAREPIILADFQNRTADSGLGQTLTEAFRVDLSQSPAVRLVDAARIADGLRRMRDDPGARLTPALARDVAQRAGVKAVVTGAIDPVGKGYVLVASVVSAEDGTVLASVRETATDETALIPALDRLSHALRERIGESLTTIRGNDPLEQVTTPSLDALQHYTAAVRAQNGGDYETAIAQLERATALDTGFAMAYRKLAAMLSNVSGSTGQMVAAATHAFEHRDRLPPLERDQTTAYYYWTVDYQPLQAVAAYHDVLARDPNDYIALNNLALLLQRQRQFSAAESLATRGIATGRCGSVCYLNLVVAQLFEGRDSDAQATIARFAAAVPGDPMVVGLQADMASGRGDYPTAERLTRQLRDQQAASPFWHEQSSATLAALALVRGHLALADQHVREAMGAAEQRGLHDHYLTAALNLGLIDALYRNRRADGLREVTQALARYPLASIPPLDRPYIDLARFDVRLGRADDARRLVGEYERVVPAGLRNGQFGRHAAAADLALTDGRYAAALAGYRAWREESGCDMCGLFEDAEVFERAGQPDSALARYERLATLRVPFRLYSDAYFLAHTYKRLGELYETKRDRAKAIDAYTHFVDLWKTADPELQPVVRDVRGRIARLSAER